MPVEKDHVRPHCTVHMFVDAKQPSNGCPGAALRHGIQFPHFESRHDLLSCTGWCMLFPPRLLRSGLPNSAPFLDFAHLRS